MGKTKVVQPPPPPAQPSYGESLADAYEAQLKYAQKLYDMEADPRHGRQAYADLDQRVIERGLIGADGQSGSVGLVGGQDKYLFAGENRSRKAGYTSSGQFKGTSGLEQDLVAQGRQENLKNITALADTYGEALTDSLRSDKMDRLIDTADSRFTNRTYFQKQRSFPKQTREAYRLSNSIRDINAIPASSGNMANMISGQGIASNVRSSGKANDVQSSGSARDIYTADFVKDVTSRDFNPLVDAEDISYTDDSRDVDSGLNVRDVSSVLSARDVSSSIDARDVSDGGRSSNVNSENIGELGGLRSALTSDALDELNNAGLTDRERRQIEEDARASATARGVARNFGSVVDEVAQLDEARRARQAEARAYAQQVAGQEAQLRSSEVASNLQSQLANQQMDEASRARALQANSLNQQKDIQASQMSLQAQLANQQMDAQRGQFAQSAELANQQADIQKGEFAQSAQLANQQRDLQASQMELEADSTNQQKDLQGSQMLLSAGLANQQSRLSAQLANQDAEKSFQQVNLQAQLANQASDNARYDRQLQADLANQASSNQAINRGLEAQKVNQANTNQFFDRNLEAQRLNQQAQEAFQARVLTATQSNQQANLQAQLANQSADQTRMASILTAGQQDADNRFRAIASNNQARMQVAQMDRDALARRIEIEQATTADPFLAITGRQVTGTNIGGASYARGQTTALPQLYNAGQGLEYMSNQQANLANYQANVYSAQAQAQAGRSRGMFGALGAIGGAAIKAGVFGCWVAREVYGEDNPKWVLFRHWMLFFSPFWFRAIYLKYGERFAKWIEDKPRLKDRIRKWMDSKIIKGA